MLSFPLATYINTVFCFMPRNKFCQERPQEIVYVYSSYIDIEVTVIVEFSQLMSFGWHLACPGSKFYYIPISDFSMSVVE